MVIIEIGAAHAGLWSSYQKKKKKKKQQISRREGIFVLSDSGKRKASL